ncbi:TonB-dependent receptor [Nannocystis pusilla]|uniref:TonB-dependent receptor plug domain-containing protein n=1 Tax=Nannocystis pusilla TaxID=889268 RepID=A0ABS7U4A8_9BACT|nr:TonB-dependent receptor [Nannocystis pusilla]MBZ5715372.1 TonB-dependent receptor plug domain-containing protein [Nannocystis pusilla]
MRGWRFGHVVGAVYLGTCLKAHAAAPPRPAPQVSPPCAGRSDCGTLRARVRAAGLRTALAEVRVVIVAASGEATVALTDAAGRLAVDLPPGKVRVVIAAPGFERLEQTLEIRARATTERQLFPRPTEWNPYRTVVRDAQEKRPEAGARSLSREEIATMPGNQGDPLRALQNMPGVARTPGGLGLLVLRGASPLQSGVFVGEHPVPRAFHALALASVVPGDVIERLDFVPGNFDARYGNASGGMVVIEPRRGRRDGVHGNIGVDLRAASALVEGPLGKRGSFIVGAQRGYVDAGLRAFMTITDSNGTVLPTYYDYQAMADFPLKQGASISARVIGAGDRIRFRFRDYEDPSGFRDAIDYRSSFHRVDVTYRKKFGPWQAMVSPALRFDVGRQLIPVEEREQFRRDYVGSLRAELQRSMSRRFELIVGADLIVDHYRARGSVPDGISWPPPEQTARGEQTWLGLYSSGRLRLGSLLLVPGFRASAFALGQERAFALDPRINALWEVSDRWRLRFGAGIYSQSRMSEFGVDARIVPSSGQIGTNQVVLPAYFANFEPAFGVIPGQNTLRVIRALQLSAGLSHDLPADMTMDATAFYRDQDQANPPLSLGGLVTRLTYGRTYGVEFLLRKPLTRRLYGWLAYTYMHSQLRFDAQHGDPGGRRPGDFDQRHNLTLVASLKLGRGWQIGGRFRLVSGQPYTPVVGSIEYEGAFVPIRGLQNSARFPPFHQLDIRVDRRWIYKRVSFLAYLDVLNVYNHQNVEMYVYSYDFRDTVGGFGLPIFPSLGLRLDW